MDLIFRCEHCDQELSVDPSGAGTQIECPSCNKTITIPQPEPQTVRSINPISTSAAAKEEKHFAVPVRSTPTEVLIEKKSKPLDEPSPGGEKRIRVRTIKRTECLEVGHDKFDETVSQFLSKIGKDNLVSVTPIAYSHYDLNTRANMNDYGVFIVYQA